MFVGTQKASYSSAPHLVVVDDDSGIVELVRGYFLDHGFMVSVAANAAVLRELFAEGRRIDVVLLDLSLPDDDGLSLTRYLREHWKGALIIISGRGESVDQVVGLELGADDYVAKPFNLRELLARVRSATRRANETHVKQVENRDHILRFNGFLLDTDTRELTDPRGRSVPLTSAEYDLLHILIAHANKVISRDSLISRIYGRDAGPYDRAIDARVRRLRQKLEADPMQPKLIKSVRSVGYLFAARIELK